MQSTELISFQIISAVGTARSMYIEGIQEAKKGNFEKAQEMLDEGEKIFNEGHHYHGALIQQEALGNKTEFDLLLIHAEDQLIVADAFKTIAEELIDVYKTIKQALK